MPTAKWNLDVIARARAAGETWRQIGKRFGRSGPATRAHWVKYGPKDKPVTESEPVQPAPEPVAEAPVDPLPSDPVDPFAEDARPSPEAPPDTPTGPVASRLGEDAARAYLPLLFGVADAVASAGAVWLVRRKLGDAATDDLMRQARMIASLSDAERAALEAALVNRLAAIQLTPDEALVYTVLGIYAAKTIAIYSLAPEPEKPLTLSVARA